MQSNRTSPLHTAHNFTLTRSNIATSTGSMQIENLVQNFNGSDSQKCQNPYFKNFWQIYFLSGFSCFLNSPTIKNLTFSYIPLSTLTITIMKSKKEQFIICPSCGKSRPTFRGKVVIETCARCLQIIENSLLPPAYRKELPKENDNRTSQE